MAVFVAYDGPKLGKKQKQLVRSQVMVLVRGRQREAKETDDVTTSSSSSRPLAPAPDKNKSRNGGDHRGLEVPEEDDAKQQQTANSRDKRNQKMMMLARRRTNPNPNVWDLRGAPPKSTHMTGVDARTFQDYLSRCGSYSSYLDEAFVLVGFRQPSYFRPDMSKAACIYIGWLLTAGVLDAFRGTQEITYPYYEYLAVRELQGFIDRAGERELHEVVYPVVILAIFEMVRFGPRAVTHLTAVKNFIHTRGGLHTMPDVMQHIVLMADTFQCLCMNTPLSFEPLGPAPVTRLMTADGFLAGNQLRSCPLLLCDDEDFSHAADYVDPAICVQLVAVLQAAGDAFREFFHPGAQTPLGDDDLAVDLNLDALLAGSPTPTSDVPRLVLETCALTARIMRRTLLGDLDALDDPENELDVLGIFHNTRFIGLKAWAGLPYIYVWVNLIGFAASTDARMRSYFIAEVVRCAFSYGCYQMEVFQAVLRNFLHLRGGLTARKLVLSLLWE